MKAASTILVLFVCIFAWASAIETFPLLPHCIVRKDGVVSFRPHFAAGEVRSSKDVAKITVPGTKDEEIVGTFIILCDDHVDQVTLKLSDDRRSYIVHKAPDSKSSSKYLMVAFQRGWLPTY